MSVCLQYGVRNYFDSRFLITFFFLRYLLPFPHPSLLRRQTHPALHGMEARPSLNFYFGSHYSRHLPLLLRPLLPLPPPSPLTFCRRTGPRGGQCSDTLVNKVPSARDWKLINLIINLRKLTIKLIRPASLRKQLDLY